MDKESYIAIDLKPFYASVECVERGLDPLTTNLVVLDVGYDICNISPYYTGEVHIDHYGRKVPKSDHGTTSLPQYTSSTKRLLKETLALYERIANPALYVRRISIIMGRLLTEDSLTRQKAALVEYSLFDNWEECARAVESQVLHFFLPHYTLFAFGDIKNRKQDNNTQKVRRKIKWKSL